MLQISTRKVRYSPGTQGQQTFVIATWNGISEPIGLHLDHITPSSVVVVVVGGGGEGEEFFSKGCRGETKTDPSNSSLCPKCFRFLIAIKQFCNNNNNNNNGAFETTHSGTVGGGVDM